MSRETLRSQIDGLLAKLETRRAWLVDAEEVYPPSDDVAEELDPLQSGYLAALIDISDRRVCPTKALHAAEVRYIGNNRYVCEACARLQKEVSR